MIDHLGAIRLQSREQSYHAQLLADEIVEARKAGHSLRDIADAAGLSHQTIANICNQENDTP
jgi:lambda repressor-like predicted transcriptional regulator